jgi:hypothetical protein
MEQHICERCGFNTTCKRYMLQHLRRKTLCEAVNKDVDVSIQLSALLMRTYNETAVQCDFCDKKFNSKPNKCRHVKICKKNPANTKEGDIIPQNNLYNELEELKKQVKELKESHVTNGSVTANDNKLRGQLDALTQELHKCRIDTLFYKNKRNEEFYQKVLELALGGTHMKLHVGITDVTTESLHAEIKLWEDWKAAVGQLMCYNNELQRDELRLYCFGKYGQKAKKAAIENITRSGIKVFEFIDVDDGVDIYDTQLQEVVYSFKVS